MQTVWNLCWFSHSSSESLHELPYRLFRCASLSFPHQHTPYMSETAAWEGDYPPVQLPVSEMGIIDAIFPDHQEDVVELQVDIVEATGLSAGNEEDSQNLQTFASMNWFDSNRSVVKVRASSILTEHTIIHDCTAHLM